jgi:hypothetical protein
VRLEQEPRTEAPRFVFVQPKLDIPAPKPPERAELSDVDRQARAVERPPAVSNPLPFARGNSTERVESRPEERARGRGPAEQPAPEAPPQVETPEQTLEAAKEGRYAMQQPNAPAPPGGNGEALRNPQKTSTRNRSTTRAVRRRNSGPCSSTPRAWSSVRGSGGSWPR